MSLPESVCTYCTQSELHCTAPIVHLTNLEISNQLMFVLLQPHQVSENAKIVLSVLSMTIETTVDLDSLGTESIMENSLQL